MGPKERFLVLIDSCRKSLGIESMEDVELLVDTFYEFGDKKKKRLEEEAEARRKELEEMSNNNAPVANAKDAKKDKKDKEAKQKQEVKEEAPPEEDEEDEEIDPNKPNLDLDDVIECLEEFVSRRQEKIDNQDHFVNPSAKKKATFQTEEQKQET